MIRDTMTINEILESYPETLDYFLAQGFKGFDDEQMKKQLGSIKLKTALSAKKINVIAFLNELETIIEASDVSKVEEGSIRISGLLPCPVKGPLLEALEEYEEEMKIKLNYDLKAASMGLEWLKEEVIDADNLDKLADVFISAGFDLFFEDALMGKFKDRKLFKDLVSYDRYNSDFENEEISLRDPRGDYSMLAVVPAVFLVNKNELGDRSMPKTWEDILSPEFEKSVSLPISDFDLFNAMLIHIYAKYGENAIRKLGKSLIQSMHPSQMVKSNKLKIDIPTITIMPYFFTKMTGQGGPMVAQWPEDGAIISPIFMLTKREKESELKEIVDFFAGDIVAKVLSHQGLFPSTNPNIDNKVDKNNKYMWVGWDYIYDNDIGKLIKKCEKLFNEGRNS